MKPLFVYGTLRDFHPNSKRFGLSGSCEVCTDVKLPGFDLFNLGWFPGIKPGSGVVTGDVFFVPDDKYPALDQYEGVPNLYTRQEVTLESLGTVQVYVYNGTPPAGSQVESGDWKDGIQSR